MSGRSTTQIITLDHFVAEAWASWATLHAILFYKEIGLYDRLHCERRRTASR
jgi:hypothetical protein